MDYEKVQNAIQHIQYITADILQTETNGVQNMKNRQLQATHRAVLEKVRAILDTTVDAKEDITVAKAASMYFKRLPQ